MYRVETGKQGGGDSLRRWTPILVLVLLHGAAIGQTIGFYAMAPVLRDKPYIAERTRRIVWMEGKDKWSNEDLRSVLMRDSAGRLREQIDAKAQGADGAGRMATVRVLDPVTMLQTDLDVAAKTYTKFPIPPEVKNYRPSPVLDCTKLVAKQKVRGTMGPLRYEELGTSTMLGVSAIGCRVTRREDAPGKSSVTEIWSSAELGITLSSVTRYEDGREEWDKVLNLRVEEPDAALFQVPADYADALAPPKRANFNPNLDLLAEFGSIEWHDGTATLIAGGSNPMEVVAETVEQCLGVPVSSERPFQMFPGDLLDVTDPKFVAQHPEPDRRVFASKPAKVQVDFATNPDGSATDVEAVLKAVAAQVNTQQPYEFTVEKVMRPKFMMFAIVPTATHDEQGAVIRPVPYMETTVALRAQKAAISDLANQMTPQMSAKTGYKFNCCQVFVTGIPWGVGTIEYGPVEKPAREVLADLMAADGRAQSYMAACEARNREFCFVNVRSVPKPTRRGVCSIPGFDPGK